MREIGDGRSTGLSDVCMCVRTGDIRVNSFA